jgi:glycosyltransferase involved in cell wall biosynthesis
VQNGTNGFLTENSQQWIDPISRLIEDFDLRRKMGQQAKMTAKDYDVSVLGKNLINIISGAL